MTFTSKLSGALLIAVAISFGTPNGLAQPKDQVYSGPQPGEKTTPFRVVELGSGAGAGQERDLIADNKGGPIALVFIHNLERSMAPLLRVIDQYGAERKDKLRTELVFLSSDRIAAEQRFGAAGKSLKLQSRMSLSLDGIEGPGNYGLNKECLMTIVIAKDNRVAANFALLQPGIADAPRILAALAKTAGDAHPPTVADLDARRQAMSGENGQRPAMRNAATGGRNPLDLSKLNLETERGLREAVQALITEVQNLRRDLDNLRGNSPKETSREKPKEEFPGAPPTDERLLGLLRQFIRPTNEDATVDKVLADVEAYIKGNPDLTQQAIDGWTRVLHFGDRYGTAYARTKGQAFLEQLKK